MKKKGIIYTVAAVLLLVVCYVIGQTLVGPKTVESNTSLYYDYTQKSDELVYEGKAETTDVPGGQTVGLVEDDMYGQYYLMTPDTAIRAGIIVDTAPHALSFQYMIHKNVSELSDGMTLQVLVLQEGTEDVLYDDIVDVDAEEKQYELSLETWENQNIYIIFRAGNKTDNRDGDWLVIKDAQIE